MMADKKPKRKPLVWVECIGGLKTGSEIIAHTRGEARAEVKRRLGIKSGARLPHGTTVEKVGIKS